MKQAVHVEGLTESIKALGKVDKELADEARNLIREGVKVVQADAKRRYSRRPGGGGYPHTPGAVRRKSNMKGAEISLEVDRYPWSAGAEFGARRAWVFGRVMSAGALRRRQFPVWRGNAFVVRGAAGPGWIVQPAIRANLDDIEEAIGDGIDKLYTRAFDSLGVPRG